MKINERDYLRLIESWLKPASQYILSPSDRPDLKCFGPGDTIWGVQTNQKALAAYAICGADPDFDAARAEISLDEVLASALAMLRYSLESHKVGSYHCLSGEPWGHHWISPLGVERMMHAVQALDEHLTNKDRDLLRAMLVSETMWFLDEYEIVAGLYAKDGKNKPESNMWNGAVMVRTATMYPDIERRDEILEKGYRLLINAISVPADANDATLKDGKPVKDRYVGPQFFESYALNHHGYLNVGYMVICLSNAAMLHFMFKEKGLEPPESLHHHVQELWHLVKKLTLPDGRLLRIGGDTRVRYCYCQDYCIPSWIMMIDTCDDRDCAAFERGWIDILNHETHSNGDGLFLSDRCRDLAAVSPLYYARLEADRACTISMGAYWRRVFEIAGASPTAPVTTDWHDDYHGAIYVRDAERVASWVWDAGEKPQGLIGTPGRSDMVEWRENLACEIKGEGSVNNQQVDAHTEHAFAGGFLTYGRTTVASEGMIAEGQKDNPEVAHQFLAYAALPDGRTTVLIQHALAGPAVTALMSVKGLHLMVPNDIFNNSQRSYYADGLIHEVAGNADTREIIDFHAAAVNIDDTLSVFLSYGAASLQLFRPGERQVGLKTYPGPSNWRAGGMLYCDELCAPCRTGHHFAQAGETLVDAGFVLRIGTHEEMDAGTECPDVPDGVRCLRVKGADGQVYILAVNVGRAAVTFSTDAAALTDLVADAPVEPGAISLAPYQARLFTVA